MPEVANTNSVLKFAMGFFLAYFLTSLFILFVVRVFFPSSLIFDQSLIIISITAFLFTFLKRRLRFSGSEVTYFIYAMLAFYIFTTSVLMNIDRSRSFYVLKWVQNNTSTYNLVLQREELGRQGVTDIQLRLDEQKKRGLISRTDTGIYRLTNSGKIVKVIADLLSRIFNLRDYSRQ